jgi:hypothetical protein
VSGDPIALLERELVSAARGRAAAGPVPAVLPWPRARRRRIRVGDALSAAAAAGAVIVALAALALLGGGGAGHPASAAAATTRDRLIATLAVLRRPQTGADLAMPELSRARTHPVFQPLLGTPDRALVRLATVAPWGAKVFLVPFRPLAPGQAGTGARTSFPGATFYAPLRVRATQGETITVYGGPGGPGNRLPGFTATDVAQGRAVVDEAGNGHARHAFRFLVAVPDGVAIVRVVFDEPHRQRPGTQLAQLVAEEPVHGNIAPLQAPGVKRSRPWVMVWLNAQHKVIKRIPLPTDLG